MNPERSAAKLAVAVEQAVKSARTIWEGDESGRVMFGDLTNAKVVSYTVGADEWTRLLEAAREVCDAAK